MFRFEKAKKIIAECINTLKSSPDSNIRDQIDQAQQHLKVYEDHLNSLGDAESTIQLLGKILALPSFTDLVSLTINKKYKIQFELSDGSDSKISSNNQQCIRRTLLHYWLSQKNQDFPNGSKPKYLIYFITQLSSKLITLDDVISWYFNPQTISISDFLENINSIINQNVNKEANDNKKASDITERATALIIALTTSKHVKDSNNKGVVLNFALENLHLISNDAKKILYLFVINNHSKDENLLSVFLTKTTVIDQKNKKLFLKYFLENLLHYSKLSILEIMRWIKRETNLVNRQELQFQLRNGLNKLATITFNNASNQIDRENIIKKFALIQEKYKQQFNQDLPGYSQLQNGLQSFSISPRVSDLELLNKSLNLFVTSFHQDNPEHINLNNHLAILLFSLSIDITGPLDEKHLKSILVRYWLNRENTDQDFFRFVFHPCCCLTLTFKEKIQLIDLAFTNGIPLSIIREWLTANDACFLMAWSTHVELQQSIVDEKFSLPITLFKTDNKTKLRLTALAALFNKPKELIAQWIEKNQLEDLKSQLSRIPSNQSFSLISLMILIASIETENLNLAEEPSLESELSLQVTAPNSAAATTFFVRIPQNSTTKHLFIANNQNLIDCTYELLKFFSSKNKNIEFLSEIVTTVTEQKYDPLLGFTLEKALQYPHLFLASEITNLIIAISDPKLKLQIIARLKENTYWQPFFIDKNIFQSIIAVEFARASIALEQSELKKQPVLNSTVKLDDSFYIYNDKEFATHLENLPNKKNSLINLYANAVEVHGSEQAAKIRLKSKFINLENMLRKEMGISDSDLLTIIKGNCYNLLDIIEYKIQHRMQ